MKGCIRLALVIVLIAGALALSPTVLHAQWLYVNDNNVTTAGNTVTGFRNLPAAALFPIPGSPWPTGGTGLPYYFALKNQAMWTLGTPAGKACLFISDPGVSPGFPAGDIAVYTVNTGTGALTPAAPFRYASPGANSGNAFGIALAAGGKTLYAGYTASNTIVVWKVVWNGANCLLSFATQIPAIGASGGSIDGMSESRNFRNLVVAYADGSVQSFITPGYGITPACATPTITTGFVDGNGGLAAGVDITRDGNYAIFGDASAMTEVEVIQLPIACGITTVDYGGTIVASGVFLGSGVNSNNVWISPTGAYLYIANNSSGQITTARLAGPIVGGLAVGCSAGIYQSHHAVQLGLLGLRRRDPNPADGWHRRPNVRG